VVFFKRSDPLIQKNIILIKKRRTVTNELLILTFFV